MQVNETTLKNIIKESVNKVLKEYYAGQKEAPDLDGKYRYNGTGTEKSKKRVNQIMANRDYDSESYKKNNTQDKFNKEYGGFETDMNNTEDGSYLIYRAIRNFAGHRSNAATMMDILETKLKTEEDAANFIKYLHKNGFKTDKFDL